MERHKTKLEILEETIQWYSADPAKRRSVDKKEDGTSDCIYVHPNGACCAVGRCFTDEVKNNDHFLQNYNYETSVNGLPYTVDHYVMEEYRGHSNKFWNSLQCLHDYKEHWHDTGLTNLGRKYADGIRRKIEQHEI